MDELTFRQLRTRAAIVAAGLLAAAVLLSPPVVGLLLSADGEIGPGARRKLIILLSSTSAALGLLLAAVAARRRWLERVWRRRRWVVLVGGVIALGLAGEFARRFVAAERPDWQQAVAFAHPAVAEVARLHQAGDDDRAFASLVDVFAAQRLRPGRWTPWSQLVPPARARAAAVGLGRGIVDLGGGKVAPWQPGEPFPWGAFNASQIFAIERGDFAVAVLAGVESGAVEGAAVARVDAAMRAFFTQWGDDARWLHRSWPGANPHVWGDDPAPNRLLAYLAWMARWTADAPLPREGASALLRFVLRHRAQLLAPGILNNKTNHGLMQNAALLALSSALPYLDPDGRLAKLARSRHSRYITRHLSPEGVSLELSPGYHCTIAHLLLFHAALRARHDEPPTAEERDILAGMLDFARAMRLPNGAFSRIADTGPYRACRELDGWRGAGLGVAGLDDDAAAAGDAAGDSAANDSAAHNDAVGDTPGNVERGEHGELPREDPALARRPALVKAWPGAGYMLLRTGPTAAIATGSADNHALPMVATLMAGPESHAHRHSDKLALTLYAGGRSLLGGPGYISIFNGRRRTLISSLGQSALHLDGESQAPGAAEVVHLAHEVSDTALRAAVLAARHGLHDDAVVERAIFYGAGARTLLVLDTVRSTRSRLVSLHERALDGGFGKAEGDDLLLQWVTAPAVTLRITRQARSEGGAAQGLPVRWRPPMAWSELRGGDVAIATRMTVQPGAADAAPTRGHLAFARELAPNDPRDDSDAGKLEWSADTLVWRGPAGTWTIPLPKPGGDADAIKQARFEAAAP